MHSSCYISDRVNFDASSVLGWRMREAEATVGAPVTQGGVLELPIAGSVATVVEAQEGVPPPPRVHLQEGGLGAVHAGQQPCSAATDPRTIIWSARS